MVWAEAEFEGSSRPLAVIYCYILTAAGKGLCFPLWPHNPLSALPGSRHSLHQGRACQAVELGQGLPTAKKERCCVPFIVLRFITSHAHRVLLPPQPQLCHFSGSSRSQFSSLRWSALQQCGTWNMPVWLQTAAIILSLLFWGSEHWWGVLQLTPGTTEQHKERLTVGVIIGDGGNGILMSKCCKTSIPVPYIIVETQIPQEPVSVKDYRWR